MAKYGSDDLGITIGGTEMKNYIDTINDFAIEALLQEGTAFGDSWVEQLYTGIKKGSDLTLEGFYDDAATTGPDAKFIPIGTTVAVVITWGGSKTTSFSAIIKTYGRKPSRGELHRYSVTLSPTAAITEA